VTAVLHKKFFKLLSLPLRDLLHDVSGKSAHFLFFENNLTQNVFSKMSVGAVIL